MILSMIAAMGKNRELGKDNKLLWHISEDLKNFKRITKGKPMIMGRKTFESLPGLLPGREHIVITKNREFRAEGAKVFYTPDEAISYLLESQTEEAMVIGGGVIYSLFLDRVDNLYLSKVDWEGQADVFFPSLDNSKLKLIESIMHEATDVAPSWEFCIYKK